MTGKMTINLDVPKETMSRVLVDDTYDPESNMTAHYIKQLDKLFDFLSTCSKIDFKAYTEIMTFIPADLGCRLRLVPDSELSSRLSHLYAMYCVVISQSPIAGMTSYSLVSIEGSNSNFPFDCDLILYDTKRSKVVFIDFTSSVDKEILNRKKGVLDSNIALHRFANSESHVEVFRGVNLPVDIETTFISDEPGTLGLKLMDEICNLPKLSRESFLSNCRDLFNDVNTSIAKIDEDVAPGDYKDYELPIELVKEASRLVSAQHDRDSLQFLKDSHDENPTVNPYYEGLMELVRNSQLPKKLIPIEGAEVHEPKDLINNLANLSADWICKVLHAASLSDNVVSIDDTDQLHFSREFPYTNPDGNLPVNSLFKASVKVKKGHIFTIHFNPSYIGDNLRRILEPDSSTKKNKSWLNARDSASSTDIVADYLDECLDNIRQETSYFSTPTLEQPKDTVWKKIWTISALASNDLENLGRSTMSLLESFLGVVSNSYLGSCIAHSYEINKTILASMKVSPGDNEYYVGVNGSYASVTIIKMCSTLDSFSKTNYSVCFKPERRSGGIHTRLNYDSTDDVYRTKFYSTDPNILSYGLRMPFVYISFATWELENNLKNGAIANGVVQQTMMDCAYLACINRDQFAQAAEQVRYFYMSAIGYGGSAADIVEKTTFIVIMHPWEFLYLMRSYKMACCLTTLSSQGALGTIDDPDTRELTVAFPHSHYPSKSFSQTISSMYVCNIYNKFRAFHEVSEAICYNDIVKELNIYKARIVEDIYAVSGLSPMTFNWVQSGNPGLRTYLLSEEFYKQERDFAILLAQVKSKRYCGSMAYIMGATSHCVEVPASIIDSIYKRVNESPVEACTMKGSMDDSTPSEKPQGIRAASAVLEALFRQHGKPASHVNNSELGALFLFDAVQDKVLPFSLFSNVILQFCRGCDPYRYRIVQKDQKGHREISVLNFNFRIGALFVETISRELSQAVGDVEVVHNPNKDKIVEDAIQESFRKDSSKPGTYCYDNSDQKRWGPNHNMNFFAYMMTVMLKDSPGLARLILNIFDKVFDKRAKFPESLIKLVIAKGMEKSGSEPIQLFMNNHAKSMYNKIYEVVISQGMCQGIFHDTSSVFHAVKSKARNHCLSIVYPGVDIKSFTTSDDAEDIYFIPKGLERIQVVSDSHNKTLRIGNLFNIVRSNPKSSFNFHIAELNSIFYKKGQMASPSLKQRIAKIDVGNGTNYMEDYLSCLSAAANYLASGGSYMGACILSVLNLTLHTEQWLRWDFVKSDMYYRPVEMGGFPVIEPISTIISGGIANFYLRSSHLMNPESYSRLIASTLLCPPEEASLSDFARSGSDKLKKSLRVGDLTIIRGAGPFGLFQQVRTDRKLSQFERRHGISKWNIPDDFVSLKKSAPLSKHFLFTLFRSTSVHTLETSLGVNSFFIRMAEPWVSYTRPCMKVSSASPFAKLFTDGNLLISHFRLAEVFKSFTLTAATAEMRLAHARCVRHSEYAVFESQLSVRLNDAQSLQSFLRGQEADSFRVSKASPTIQTVSLRGHSASDSDSYHLAMVKSLAGRSSAHLINSTRRSALAYDATIADEPIKPLPLTVAIILADNAISVYDKFIRRNTKMTIPNKVETIKDLCLDILRNKFTERMGLVVNGDLELNPERSKPHAYSSWYQNLLELSEAYESKAANAVLSGKPIPVSAVGVSSKLAVVTRTDMFDLDQSGAPTKTVRVDSRNKDSFVNTIKLWLAANVKFVLSIETIKAFVKGRLTFGHDYYVGDNSFIRYAKTKYFRLSARGVPGTHVIKVIRKKELNKDKYTTSYRHYFIFSQKVEYSDIKIELTPESSNQAWAISLKSKLEESPRIIENKWISLDEVNSYSDKGPRFRSTVKEKDYVIMTHISPGMEFEQHVNNGSLSYGIKRGSLYLPISYLNPASIETMCIGYKLTDADLKVSTKAYVNLRNSTSNFDRIKLRTMKLTRESLDFIITGSTTSTPEWLINKKLFSTIRTRLNAIQLDILRTQLILNPNIGVHYSSGRFTQYLLNLGARRKAEHSYFSRRIAGDRVDYDSEDWDGESEEEEFVKQGVSDRRELREFFVDEDTLLPGYLEDYRQHNRVTQAGSGDDQSDKDELEPLMPTNTNWADDAIEAAEENLYREETMQTREELSWDLESDDSDNNTSDVDLDRGGDDSYELASGLVSQRIPVVTMAGASGQLTESILENPVLNMNDAFSAFNFDDVFNPEEDDDDQANITEAVADVHMEGMGSIFKKAIEGSYGRIIEEKDAGLKSEITGHTVNPGLEHARTMISFVKGWLGTVGKLKEQDQQNVTMRDVTGISSIYVLLHDMGLMDSASPLKQFSGSDEMELPVDLSALAVVSTMY